MASTIYLGNLFGKQNKVFDWKVEKLFTTTSGKRATIAKGNIIEGIEAKE